VALDLTMTITADASQAKAELRQVEQGIQKIETTSTKAEGPINKVVNALSGQSAATEKVVQSTTKLDEGTAKATKTVTASSEAWRKETEEKIRAALGMDDLTKRGAALDKGMVELNATRAAGTAGIIAMTGAAVSLGLVAAAELKFVYEASKAYATKSGILDEHAESIAGVKDAWDDLLFTAGQALVGSGQNFTGWINTIEAGLRIMGAEITRRIDDFRTLLGLVGMVGNIPSFVTGGGWEAFNGGMPTPQNATKDADGNLTAYGRMVDSQRIADMVTHNNGADVGRTSPQEAERLFWASERERISAEKRAADEARRAAEAERKKLDAAMVSTILAWMPDPRNDHPWDFALDGTNTGIGLSRKDLLATGINAESIGALYDAGQGMFTRPRNDDVFAIGPQNISYESLFPGGNFMGIVPRNDKSGLSQFLGASFGSAGQFGSQLSGTILQAITGGGSMLGGIGSLIGGNAGSGLASMLTGGVTPMLSGFLGGAANAVLPGVGALLGPAISWLGNKLFGKSAGRQELDAYNGKIDEQQAGLLGQFGSLDNIRSLDKIMGTDLAGGWGHQGKAGFAAFGQEAQRFASGASGAMNEMIASALTAGQQIPAAMLPILESMIRQGDLTRENANLLMGLPAAGVPGMAEIAAAADILGVSVDSLGDKVKQIGLTETAEQAAQAWLTLERAGADMGAVAAASAEQMQGYINQAIEYGFSLPEALRPAVETMRDLGLISGDLEQIEWAKPLTQSVDELVTALKELVATLRGDLVGAIDEVNGKEISVRGKVDIDRSGYAPVEEGGEVSEGMPIMHGGGEVPVLAQSGEYMMRRSAVQQYGRSFMAAVNSGNYQAGGTTAREVIIPITLQMLDGRVLAEVVARETLQ
jgi:hypothetical protein